MSAHCNRDNLGSRQSPMYFKKVEHGHDRVAPQVGRTIMVNFLEMDMREVSNILQVTLELSDEILR